MSQKIRIVLIDEHSLFRESLSLLLQDEADLEIAGSCATIRDALAVLETTPADLVLLDEDIGDGEAWSFFARARHRGYHGRVLIVTDRVNAADILWVLRAGCSGVFSKHRSPAQLIEAIRQAAAGEIWIDPAAQSLEAAGTPFTPRESSVMDAVAQGLANKEVAARLHISEGAVKAALQQLFAKTGVRTRTQLVRIVLEHQGHRGLPRAS
jgi:DNA-binding NarL/FixJ family response regulator